MYILFPGRHLLLTKYQFNYIYRIINGRLSSEKDVNGLLVDSSARIEGIIFAVTSANHSNTRRNPVPFYLRSMQIAEFGRDLDIPVYIYGIDDVGSLENFNEYVIKRIYHLSGGKFSINPNNTLVLCSTPVLESYANAGFTILPCERTSRSGESYKADLPWNIIEKIAAEGPGWKYSHHVLDNMHPASYKVWKDYNLGDKANVLFHDTLIGNDGDITETRDYNSYVRQMDEIAELKFSETENFIRPGRIGDIGCAAGSWIKLAAAGDRFSESDFFGIEIARKLFDICEQRKNNGDFKNPFVFFSQKNAVTGLVFEKESMNTVHTSSLTHEIYSYGSENDLKRFIANRYNELASGGVWINRDVLGPEDGDGIVYMLLDNEDGHNEEEFRVQSGIAGFLEKASTYRRFIKFAEDFRKKENDGFSFETETHDGVNYIKIRLRDACEFMYKKDYTDNWESEMHEKFCFWSFSDWRRQCEDAGFRINSGSSSFRNEWIIRNRLDGKVKLFRMSGSSLEEMRFPETHMVLIAEKI